MNPPSTPPPLPKFSRHRLPLGVRIFLALLLVFIGGILGTCAWYRLSNDAAVRKLEAEARKRGEPLTLSELATNYPAIPDGENAAITLMDIWERDDPEFWNAFRSGVRPLPERTPAVYGPNLPVLGSKAPRYSRRDALSPEGRIALETFVKSNAVHSTAIQTALRDRSRVRFSVQITDGVAALLPHLARLKTEAQHLRLETILEIERGDVSGAIACMRGSERLATALKDEPFLISQLVRIAIQLPVVIEGERLLSRHALSEADLGQLSAIFESIGMAGALKQSFIAERASLLSVYEMSESTLKVIEQTSGDADEKPVNPAYAKFGIRLFNLTGIVSADRRFMLENMERAVNLAEKNSPESLAEIDVLFDRVERQMPGIPPKLISALMLPSLKRVAPKFTALEARRRLGLLAIIVERCRLANNGRLPDRLEELVPGFTAELPKDPFDGQPLRYRKLEKGFVVYSVGADRKDQQGRERRDKRRDDDIDETFYIER